MKVLLATYMLNKDTLDLNLIKQQVEEFCLNHHDLMPGPRTITQRDVHGNTMLFEYDKILEKVQNEGYEIHPFYGKCFYVSHLFWYLVGDVRYGYDIKCIKKMHFTTNEKCKNETTSHWYVTDERDGTIWDLTAVQFDAFELPIRYDTGARGRLGVKYINYKGERSPVFHEIFPSAIIQKMAEKFKEVYGTVYRLQWWLDKKQDFIDKVDNMKPGETIPYIVGTFNKIPKKETSHSYGWARTWAENLGATIDHSNSRHDKVYLLHGANFGGSLNLFGGFNRHIKSQIDHLLNSKEIISLDIDCPDYGEMLKKRKDVKEAGLEEWCDTISEKLKGATTLIASDLEHSTLAIGDSHTAAYSPENSSVVKRDGTTLFSQIRTDFEYIRSHIKPHHKKVVISLGNIDIRHHLCRVSVDKPMADIGDMIEKYAKFVKELEGNGIEVEVATPWPIEFEGRKLPKTGYYKGQPFWGSWTARNDARKEFVEACINNGLNMVQYPDEWLNMDPKDYADNMMEKPQSVHLSPTCYRRMNWGQCESTLEGFM